ncbi:MAG TPA: thioredoxin domain-containing protein [Gemmatimonadaceae bacterium]|jgi:protein-disulfide isomerase
MSGASLATPVSQERDHVAGAAGAPVTLVEYGDFECSYCGRAYPIVKSLQETLGAELRFVFRNFPLTDLHPHAEHAAEAAESAAAQDSFWEMHDTLFEHQDRLDDQSLVAYGEQLGLDAEQLARELEDGTYESRVREDFRTGVRSGVNGTPSFFINGERYDGNWTSAHEFLGALRSAANQA